MALEEPKTKPSVSIVIVNRNGILFIENCLSSVLKTEYPNFEVIVVDNASTDESIKIAREKFSNNSRLKFIFNKDNYGPARSRNIGIGISRGEYIAFLDNDTEVDPLWLREAVRVLESDSKIGSVQCKILSMDDRGRFDDAGSLFSTTGFLIERSDSGLDLGQFNEANDIFSAKSAASICRKKVIDEIGPFDEDYFMYLEETDLSWRMWLGGYHVVFAPSSVVYHAFGSPKKAKAEYYPKELVRFKGCRNYITTLIKNLSTSNLVRILPLHIASWLAIATLFLFKGKFLDSWFIIKAVFWNLYNLPRIWLKRRYVQSAVRKVTDNEIFSKVMSSRPLKYYFLKTKIYIRDGYGADSVSKAMKL